MRGPARGIALAAIWVVAALPASAQDAVDADEDAGTDAAYLADIKAIRDEWQPEPLTCDAPDPPLGDDVRERTEAEAVSDELAFDCKYDWLQVERLLQPLLARVPEPSLATYKPPKGATKFIAVREVVVAYTSPAVVQSVLCHFRTDPRQSWNDIAIGGTARSIQLRSFAPDDEVGIWEMPLNRRDCDYLMQVMEANDPDDIVHEKPFGNPLSSSGEIILVHGESFIELVDEWGNYSVKLRPGLSEMADAQSERAEASFKTILGYFANRARAEGRAIKLSPPAPSAEDKRGED